MVSAAALFGGSSEVHRFITLRLGERAVVLAVDEVIGVEKIGEVRELPPLLSEANAGVIDGIGQLDSELLLILRSGYLAPFAEAG